MNADEKYRVASSQVRLRLTKFRQLVFLVRTGFIGCAVLGAYWFIAGMVGLVIVEGLAKCLGADEIVSSPTASNVVVWMCGSIALTIAIPRWLREYQYSFVENAVDRGLMEEEA